MLAKAGLLCVIRWLAAPATKLIVRAFAGGRSRQYPCCSDAIYRLVFVAVGAVSSVYGAYFANIDSLDSPCWTAF